MDERIINRGLTRREALRLGLYGTVGVGLAACAPGASPVSASPTPSSIVEEQPSAALIKAAQAEGSLTYYYAAPPNVHGPMMGAFSNKYGIPVNATQAISATMIIRFTAEMQASKPVADVIHLSDTDWIQSTAIPKDWVIGGDAATMPALKGWPASAILKNTAYLADISLYTICYNTNLVKPSELQTWEDTLNPKWKGLVIMLDPRASTVNLAWMKLMQNNFGDKWLTGLAAQNPKLTTSARTSANNIAAGEAALLIPSNHFNNTPLLAAGAPLADVAPPGKTSVTGVAQWMTLVKNAPHPNAAKLFMNFALSKEGQLKACGDELCSSPLNLPGTAPLPSNYTEPPIAEALADRANVIRLLGLS